MEKVDWAVRNIGKDIRLGRIFGVDGRTVLITFDHAIPHGVMQGLERPWVGLGEILRAAPDGVVLQKGTAARYLSSEELGKTALILKATSYSRFHPTRDFPTANVREAVRLGADAISVGVIVGGRFEGEQMEQLAAIVDAAGDCGLPVGAHIYARGEDIGRDGGRAPVEETCYAARFGAELGVDFVKTEWPGDSEAFARVVDAAGIPVLLAGGVSGGLDDLFATTEAAVKAGCTGVAYGRRIWQAQNVGGTIDRLKEIVHAG